MPFLGTITSSENQTLKYVRSLQQKKRVRYREKRYVVEGSRSVAHALERGVRPVFAFYTEAYATAGARDLSGEGGEIPASAGLPTFADADMSAERANALIARLLDVGASVWQLSPALLELLADTVTPQGILAVVPMPEIDSALACRADLVLVLDNIRDPGNLGTILRTAQAAGVQAVLLSEGCVDPFAPKVVRSAMGAHLHLPILPDLGWPMMRQLLEGKQCVLADMHGPLSLWEVDWTLPTALLVGSEAFGASPGAREMATLAARLPMAGDAESLNVAVATAILLYEAQRQRHFPPAR